jgi:hypothetical protein
MQSFSAKRVTRTYTQQITAPPHEVFPLLCPVREREWVEGWECEVVYSRSGLAEEGCVFTTQREGEAKTVWTITAHDPVGFQIEFVMVTPESRVGGLRVRLERNADDTTSAHVAYTFTALSEKGNAFVDEYTEESFRHKMEHWERSMNHYLRTGSGSRLTT